MLATLRSSKLTPPPAHDGLVDRARLSGQLAAASRVRLLLVVAPAGFGKTSLLSAWLKEVADQMQDVAAALPGSPPASRRAPPEVAWLSLDERDNDPTRFWGYLIATLDATAPGIGDQARAMLQSPTPPPATQPLGALLDELAQLEGERLLILDDYHQISAEAIHEGIAFLIDHAPVSLRVVIASRGEPPLPLARWRLRGQLAELRANDLRFTIAETDALLRLAGLQLDQEAAAALTARTEGWAGALALAARSLRDSADPQARIATFAGNQRHLFDYLADEVLRRQPLALQRFLLDSAILDPLSVELCDAVVGQGALGQPSAARLLDEIERAGLFLMPLDEERRWYRYHALFGEFLRERLRRSEPARPALLHRRAAAWYAAQNLPVEAVSHLLAAGDSERAADLIEQQGRPLLLRSEVATVLGWLAALPPQLVRARPGLCLIEAWARAVAGQFEATEEPLAAVEATLAAYSGDPDTPAPFSAPYTPRNLASEALAVRATVAGLRREAGRAIELARRALEALPDDSVLVRGVVALMLGTSAYLEGDLAASAPALEQAAAFGRASGMPIIAIFALRLLAELQTCGGQLHRAVRTYQEAIDLGAALYPSRDGASRPVPVVGAAYVGLGMLRYEWNELDAAAPLLADGLRLGRQGENAEILLMGPVGLARLQHARGETATARTTLARALAYARATGVPRLVHWLGAEQIRLDLRSGDLAAAVAWDQERQLDPDGPLSYLEEIDFLSLARLRIAQGRPTEALRLLTRLRSLAEAQGRNGSLVEIFALAALAARAAGDQAGAQTALGRALALAAPAGYVRTFVDMGEPMRLQIYDLRFTIEPGNHSLLQYIDMLLAAFPAENAGSERPQQNVYRKSQMVNLVEAPTPRELEVLGWINEGLSNDAIAEKLVVGLSTVKKHINNLYAKLEVASRTQALKRARELGLIE